MIDLLRQLIREQLENDSNFSIYCDMDGVLVNFHESAIKMMNDMLKGTYGYGMFVDSKSMRRSLRKLQSEMGEDWVLKDKNDLENKNVRDILLPAIGYDPGDFFANLKPLSDGIDHLWPFLNSLGKEVNILSAPVETNIRAPKGTQTAKEGKQIWIKRYLNPQPTEVLIVPAREKQKFAITQLGTSNILIDDKERTIDQWNSRGGIGILHITGNSQRTIDLLKQSLLDK